LTNSSARPTASLSSCNEGSASVRSRLVDLDSRLLQVAFLAGSLNYYPWCLFNSSQLEIDFEGALAEYPDIIQRVCAIMSLCF
jgi:hypothetical protein